ncbi:MAG: glycosyltransferase, partial [Bacteroidetes bacterium]|nr:glycosyltransferase [Bacteroidota bacterium]
FWCTEYAMVAKYFAIRNGLKHFIWLKGQDAREGNQFVRLIKPKENELIAISDFVADEFYRNYKVRPLHVVPNAIDESLFADGQVERDIDILGVGSLIPLKQYDIFIEIVKELKTKVPDINAVICGKGPEADKLKGIISTQLLNNHIAIIGERPHAEVLKLMQRSKILLHPSSYEGFSTVCLEALYAGMHVVSFHKPMKEDIKNWHIVKDKNEMTQKAMTLLADLNVKFERVRVYAMEDTVNTVMRLFNT